MLQIQNVNKAFGPVTIFEDATVSFLNNQKVGVIGQNGSGKTTLCKIITGEEKPEGGVVVKSNDLRLAYLEQQDAFRQDEGVLDFLIRYTGREEWECARIAGRFQLKNELLTTPIGSLSGGFQTRVKLVAMLLGEPNFLVLDEPTNYLDLKTLILLENFLKDYSGTFLIVSHDREFLKRTCDHTLDVENGGLTLYPGNVEDYLEFKQEQLDHRERYNKNLEARQKQIQTFIDKFKARKDAAARAKSKQKQIERLEREKIEIQHPMSRVRIRMPYIEPKKGIALQCHELAIGYPDKIVAENIDFDMNRGANIAVLGDNGEGKTTFLRTIAGDLTPRGGSFKWGHNLTTAFYAQHIPSMLNPDETVYDHLRRKAAPDVTHQEILNMAGSFLFQGDDVDKRISILSGGERARVCLAGLLLSKTPVLLLDEPSSHLDFETVEALGEALQNFNGTIFFTSHDRTFVSLVATEILEVKNTSITRLPGNYEEYVYHLETLARENGDEPATKKISDSRTKEKPKSDYTVRKERKAQLNKIKNQIRRAERQLDFYHKEQETIASTLQKENPVFPRDPYKRLDELSKLIKRQEDLWLKLTQQMDSLERDS